MLNAKGFTRLLWVLGVTVILTACTGGAVTAQTPVGSGEKVMVAPLKIPMPLDKAGHKVDVTFDVPEPQKGERARGYFLGLRILFAPATGQVPLLEAHPVKVRVTMHRLQSGFEHPVELGRLERINSFSESGQYAPLPIKHDVAIARGDFTELSDAPPGTPDASTRVMLFAAPRDSAPGRYRLCVETLEDLPLLSGFKAFLTFEQNPKR